MYYLKSKLVETTYKINYKLIFIAIPPINFMCSVQILHAVYESVLFYEQIK